MKPLFEKDFIEIGFLRKGHGYKGHAKVEIKEELEKDLLESDFIFFLIDGNYVPFYIQEKLEKKGLILKLEQIESMEELKKFHKMPIYLLKEDVKFAADYLALNEQSSRFVGMRILDEHLGDLGSIIRVDEFPQQEMAVILNKENQEILIPLHPSLIIDILEEDLIIKMDLPEGLV